MKWFADGISICGSRHAIDQDSMAVHHLDEKDGWLLVVSDGLGSKKKSQIGSASVCEAVLICVCENPLESIFAEPVRFMELVHKEWLQRLGGEPVGDCCATALFCIVLQDRALAMQVGDGFIAFCADGEAHALFDDKSEHYVNETDCFQEAFDPELVRYAVYEFDVLQGALLCSDGVEIGDMCEAELKGFAQEFVSGFADAQPGSVKCQVKGWLRGWPGTDDKTAAYLLSKGEAQ